MLKNTPLGWMIDAVIMDVYRLGMESRYCVLIKSCCQILVSGSRHNLFEY